MFKTKMRGKWEKTNSWLEKVRKIRYSDILEQCARDGLEALRANTPQRTGLTASMWRYEVSIVGDRISIGWYNDNRTYQGDPIVVLLYYGHGTGTGGYVKGEDFISPAIQPIFDHIGDTIRKVVIES